MGLLARLTGRRPAPLTCVVQRQGGAWSVSWRPAAGAPGAFVAESLTAAIERATTAGAAAEQASRREAGLLLAIYPWTPTTAELILDVEPDVEGYLAVDALGSGTFLRAASLDGLVREAEQVLPDPRQAILRWVRPAGEPGGGDVD
jgi:hypothetical protein